MTTMSKTLNIVGANRLTDWFGSWPTFQDAHILEVNLSAEEDSSIKLRTAERKPNDTARGVGKIALVTFYISEITDVQLNGFNKDSALVELQVEQSGDAFKIAWTGAGGTKGSITAGKLSVGLNSQNQPI